MSEKLSETAIDSESIAYYRPSAWYFRRELRDAPSKAQAIRVGLTAVRELESLTQWVQEQGLEAPRWYALRIEADEKGWLYLSSRKQE